MLCTFPEIQVLVTQHRREPQHGWEMSVGKNGGLKVAWVLCRWWSGQLWGEGVKPASKLDFEFKTCGEFSVDCAAGGREARVVRTGLSGRGVHTAGGWGVRALLGPGRSRHPGL